MKENTEVLQDIVVTGYGNVSKGSFAGSAQAVDAENIEKKSPSEISKALAGEVAGVQVVTTTGQPGEAASIRIRGIGSLYGGSSPLYVVDGVPYDASYIATIDPGDIASTTILKDATATSLYGSRGANGVIVITTKKGSSGEEGRIDVDVKYGANMRLLPMYEVITDPKEFVEMAWMSLYNTNSRVDPMKRIQEVNNLLYSAKGIPIQYQLWQIDGIPNDQVGSLLIDNNGKFRGSEMGISYKPGMDNLPSWKDAIFRVGQKVDATVKISGGTGKTTYFASVGYLKDEGYYIGSSYDRFTTRCNVDFQPKKWLKGNVNMAYTYSNQDAAGQGDNMNNGFAYVNQIPPIFPVYLYNEDGTIQTDPKTGGYAFDYGMFEGAGRAYGAGINPAGSLRYDRDNRVQHFVMAGGSLEFKFYKDLKLTINANAQYSGLTQSEYTNAYYGDAAGIGRTAKYQYNQFWLTLNQLLEYNKSFNEHTIRVMAGHETTYFTYNMQYGYKKNIAEDNVNQLSNGVSMDGVEGYARTSTLESALATATYEYDNRYHITGNYRADGSSKFAKGHRWGHFGSVGGAWSFTNEHFMEGTEAADWLKNGKLRLSWGVLGNQDIGDMMFSDQYNVENVNDEKGYVWSYKGNPDLTWERTSTIDLGLELSISKYLDFTFDYFYKKTDNMLFPRYVAPSIGYGGYYVNDAAMENQGIEFDLKAHLVDLRNVKLDFRLNGGYYRNKMLKMPVDYTDASGVEHRMVMSGGMSVGHSTYDWYITHYEGIDDEGVAHYTAYYDADKGEFGTKSADLIKEGEKADNYIASVYEYKLQHPNADIREHSVSGTYASYAGSNYVGKSAMPDLDGGFGIDLEAYGVTLSVSCSYRIGGYGYDNMYALLMHSDKIGSMNWHKDIMNAWTENNTNTNIPRLSNGADENAVIASDRFLTSNSYLSLNNINLGYKFPKKLIEKIKLTNLQVFVAADNLAIASARKGYNPMMSMSGTNGYDDYSPLSTVMGGIKVQF